MGSETNRSPSKEIAYSEFRKWYQEHENIFVLN